MDNKKIYSQNQEQSVIEHEFERLSVCTGRLLEIGAYDPCAFSNSRALIEKGWSAVMVEPSPKPFSSLVEAYKNNPLISLVNAAISPDRSRLLQWHDSGGDAISTTSPEHKLKWETGWAVKYSTFWVYTMPLIELFHQFGYSFDFINIDVESTNLALYSALPWPLLKDTKVICVEHDGNQHTMAEQAKTWGFQPLHLNGENLILTRQLA